MADLTTYDAVAAWLGTKSTADDGVIARLITSQSRRVEAWCGRTFGLGTYIERVDGTGGPGLSLAQFPIVGVASVVCLASGQLPSAGEVLDPGDYLSDETGITRTDGGVFCAGCGNIQVTYTAGFATIPEDVADAVIDLVARKFRARGRIGVRSESLNGQNTSYDLTGMPDEVASVLAPYKRVVA